MRYSKVYITSFGYELPPYAITSEDLEDRLGPLYQTLHIQKGQLEGLTGVLERRFWDPDYKITHCALKASEKAIGNSSIAVENIGMLVYGGVCRKYREPAAACAVAHRLGLNENTIVYDVSIECLGVINGILRVADAIELGQIRAGLVVSCESSREIIDTTIEGLLQHKTMNNYKKSIATLTGGSGAVAVLLSDENASGKGHALLGGAICGASERHRLCTWEPIQKPSSSAADVLETDSLAVLKSGVALGKKTFDKLKRVLNISNQDFSKVICHQVGASHQKTILKALGIPEHKNFSTYAYLGNIGAASLPMSAAIATQRDFLAPDDFVGLLGIGSRLNCIMLGIKWFSHHAVKTNKQKVRIHRKFENSSVKNQLPEKMGPQEKSDRVFEKDRIIHVELTINPEEFPIIKAHVLGAKPVVPFALIMELFSSTLKKEFPELCFYGFNDIRIFKGLRYDHRSIPTHIESKIIKEQAGMIEFEAKLWSREMTGRQTLNASARIIFSYDLPTPMRINNDPKSTKKEFPYRISEIYDKILFHDTALQGLKKIINFSSNGITAEVGPASKPETWIKRPLRTGWISDPLFIDSAFQLASIWCYAIKGAVSLPSFAKTYRQFVPAFQEIDITISLEAKQTTNKRLTGALYFVNKDNKCVAVMSGFEAVMDESLYKAFKPQYADN